MAKQSPRSGEAPGVRAELARPRYKVELFGKPAGASNELPGSAGASPSRASDAPAKPAPPLYQPDYARPTEEMQKLHLFRGIHPLYAVFLVNQLGIASRAERLQAMESVLELPRSIGPAVRVPLQKDLPPGPLATLRLDPLLLQLGLATAEELTAPEEPEEYPPRRTYEKIAAWVLTFADKLRKLFDYDFPECPRLEDFSRLGGRRTPGIRRRFQQVRHRQDSAKAGRVDLPPLAAADPARQRIRPTLAAGHQHRRVARRPRRHRIAPHRMLPPSRSDEHRQGSGRSRRRNSRCRGRIDRAPTLAFWARGYWVAAGRASSVLSHRSSQSMTVSCHWIELWGFWTQ